MPSRRDLLKATGGLVLATGGSWLASHAHGAVPNPPGLAPVAGRRSRLGRSRDAAGQAAADQAELAAAELRNTAFVFFRRDHAEPRVFRALSPGRDSRDRGRPVERQDRRRRGRHTVRAQSRAAQARLSRDRGRRRKPMLGQSPRPVRAACPRRGMGHRRDGQCALERRAAQGHPGQSRVEEGGARNRIQRRRRAGDAGHARLPEIDPGVEGARREHARRLRDEWRTPAALERLSCAHRRARLDRNLLDEARDLDQRDQQAIRQFLGQVGISHSAR